MDRLRRPRNMTIKRGRRWHGRIMVRVIEKVKQKKKKKI